MSTTGNGHDAVARRMRRQQYWGILVGLLSLVMLGIAVYWNYLQLLLQNPEVLLDPERMAWIGQRLNTTFAVLLGCALGWVYGVGQIIWIWVQARRRLNKHVEKALMARDCPACNGAGTLQPVTTGLAAGRACACTACGHTETVPTDDSV